MSKLLGYDGNPKLRRAHLEITLTKEQMAEVRKCRKDPIYFTKKYVKIIALGRGIVDFDLYPFQEDMMTKFKDNRFVICKIPRQSGKSITTIAFLLWCILFKKHYNIAIVAHKGPAANGLLQRLKLAFENLPLWLQHGIITWNKGDIELENGSKIGAFATTADGLRSGSFDIVLLDEFAFVANHIAEAFYTSTYPVITAGTSTKIFIISTPKGMNHFHDSWQKAIKGKSEFIPIEVHWSAVPGRDQAWKEKTISNTSEEQFKQEFETEFLGSSATLISPTKLGQLIDFADDPIEKDGDDVSIWEQPIRGHTYVVSVDVSEGTGNDNSAFSVVDVTEIPYRHVCTYRNDKITPFLFPTIILQYAMKYNEAFVLVEINSIGLQVADILHYELAYENLIKVEMKGKQGQQHTPGFKKKIAFGLKHNKQTKAIGCANIKTLIENDKLTIHDRNTIAEMTTFVFDKGTYKAEEGCRDDRMMCLVNFGWLTGQRYFKENINNNIRQTLQEEQMYVMDSDIVPFGIISNGLDDFADGIMEDAKEKWVINRQKSSPFDTIDWEFLSNKFKL